MKSFLKIEDKNYYVLESEISKFQSKSRESWGIEVVAEKGNVLILSPIKFDTPMNIEELHKLKKITFNCDRSDFRAILWEDYSGLFKKVEISIQEYSLKTQKVRIIGSGVMIEDYEDFDNEIPFTFDVLATYIPPVGRRMKN